MGHLGSRVVVRRHGLRWVWHYMTGEVEIAAGDAATKKKALADAQSAATVWLAEAWRMIKPGSKMTDEQKRLCTKFCGS